MLFALVLQLAVVFQDSVPYKPDEEFVVNFDFSFNRRRDVNRNDESFLQVTSSTTERPDSPLPYISANLEILRKHESEVKFKIIRDHDVQVAKKKITEDMRVTVFSGFVDDLKDQVSGYNYTIYFLDRAGKSLSKIVIEFDDEGFYLVNGKRRGKL